MNAELKFIGHVETPYETLEECPRNIDPTGPLCRLVVKKKYAEGLSGLRAGERILILYWLEGALRRTGMDCSRMSGELRGTFGLRTPHRPNPIGAAVLPIVRIQGEAVSVNGLDCLNGTPLLDIKPAIKLEKGD